MIATVAKKIATKKIATPMITNPFKFGSIVEEPFFTNRHDELGKVQSILSSNSKAHRNLNNEFEI
jgi:hypothetical protein